MRETVPATIAGWSPRVHSLSSQSLHGRVRLDTLTSERDRAELWAAFRQTADELDQADTTTGVSAEVRQARASLRGNDLDASLRHLAAADELRRQAEDLTPAPRETAVSNVWRSDVSAAAEVRAQAVTDPSEPLREEELEMLARVEPAQADLARAHSTHRRPERAIELQQAPGHDRGRSV